MRGLFGPGVLLSRPLPARVLSELPPSDRTQAAFEPLRESSTDRLVAQKNAQEVRSREQILLRAVPRA